MNKREKTDWPDVMVDRLTRLHADPERSFDAIAATLTHEFGVKLTKNACIGKARRLGLAARTLSSRPRGPDRPRGVQKRALSTPQLTVLPAWQVETPVLPKASGRITIYQLQRGVCHFPYGDTPPYAYCGNTTTRHSPWCPHHERVVYPRGMR